MENLASTTTKKKHTMSPEVKQRIADAQKERWAKKKETEQPIVVPAQPPAPVAPSPAVTALQSQVVELVGQRSAARQRLTASHAEYLMAQSKFQAEQESLKGIETEVQYRINLIAQLENRPVSLQFPSSVPLPGYSQTQQLPPMDQISVDPAPVQRPQYQGGQDDMVSRATASHDPNSLTGSMM
jgi:hypothetical protein